MTYSLRHIHRGLTLLCLEKEFNVTKGFQAVKWFKEQFGYSEGATQLLEKWNPGVDFKKLKIGKAVMLMQ